MAGHPQLNLVEPPSSICLFSDHLYSRKH